MVKQTLPCAEKNCKSKMKLTKNKDNILTYKCLEKPQEHIFRYYINQKTWEKIIIKAKRLIRYTQNPCEETVFDKVYEPE